MKLAPAKSGFTLIEVLATLVLIAIVMPVVMKGVSLAATAGKTAQRDVEAMSLAESKLNELSAMNQWTNSAQSGDFGEDWPDYKWTAQSISRDTTLMEVSVQVTWLSRGVERSVSVSTLVYTGNTGVTQ